MVLKEIKPYLCILIKEKNDLTIGKTSTHGLYDTTIPAEAECSINFREQGKIF